MDELNPNQGYNPEDEYESIESTDAPAPEQAPAENVRQSPDQPEVPQAVQPVAPQEQQIRQNDPVQRPQQPAYPQQPNGWNGYQAPPQRYYPQQQPYQPQPPMPPQGYPQQPRAYQGGYAYPPQQAHLNQPQANIPPQPNQGYGTPPSAQYQQNPPYPNNPYNPQGSWQQPAPAPQKPPKTPTPTGTKVFIIVLCALLAAMVIGFVVYIANASGNKSNSNAPSDFGNGGFNIYDGGNNGGSNGNGFFIDNNGTDNYTEIEDEITLVADNGDTQKRDDDNEDSVGKPNEDAKAIKLEELPKDKDDEKYTTTSAYNSVCDSVVTVECFEGEITDNDRDIVGAGSGTIISADGYIVTNAHVLGNSKRYAVNIILNNSKEYQAKIIGYDTWTDLALMKIDAEDLKPVTFGDSSLVNVGDDVIAIGSPGGEKFQNSLTKGIVSAVDRELSINRYVRYIQSDAAISPGNSGGPLCNIYGQVIGITTAKTVATNYENMSFSIPSSTVKEIIDDIMHYGYVKERTRVGFVGSEISQEEVVYYGYPEGILITELDETGSLAGSKIKEGDIITELDGVQISSFQDIYDVLADHKPGDKISVKAIRYESK